MKKINIQQMALAGMMLALLTVTKYMDIIMLKTPLGYSWVEIYMIFVVLFILVLPIPITTLVLVCAPFIWLALGQTSQQSPVGFFLDYSLPLIFMEIICFARLFKNKVSQNIMVLILIITAFFLKWLSHSISGVVAWETPFVLSAIANAPMVFVTMVVIIAIIIPLLSRLEEIKLLINKKDQSWNSSISIEKYFENIISFKKIKGHFNDNYKVKTLDGYYHLKIFKDRTHEIKKWIPGRTIKKWNIEYIKRLDFEISKLVGKAPEMNLLNLNIQDKKYLDLINKYKDVKKVFCHNDINKDNVIVESNFLYLIDFEFARMNHPYWEYANIIVEDNVNLDLFLNAIPWLKREILEEWVYINKTYTDAWKNKWKNK